MVMGETGVRKMMMMNGERKRPSWGRLREDVREKDVREKDGRRSYKGSLISYV